MCEKFSRYFETSSLRELYNVNYIRKALDPKAEVFPGEQVPVLVGEPGGRVLTNMAWGLIPVWMKSQIKPLINARAETLTQLPTFNRLLKNQRCIIPASGYFDGSSNKSVSPYHYISHKYISHKDYPILGFAGLWDENQKLVSGQKKRVTIITQSAENNFSHSPAISYSPISHSLGARMPLILTPQAAMQWLDPTLSALELRAIVSSGKVKDLQESRWLGEEVQFGVQLQHEQQRAA